MFNNLSTTTEQSADMMTLLGLAHYDLDNPRKFAMFQDVTKHFGSIPNWREKMLRILSKGYGDKLDNVWTYVELQNEKARAIQQLDPSQFAEDIEEQIKTGILTQENIKRIKKDIETFDTTKLKEYKQAEQDTTEAEAKVGELLAKPTPVDILQETKKHLSEVERINKELSFYE